MTFNSAYPIAKWSPREKRRSEGTLKGVRKHHAEKAVQWADNSFAGAATVQPGDWRLKTLKEVKSSHGDRDETPTRRTRRRLEDVWFTSLEVWLKRRIK